jgi:glycosyltransferase involved in cell wall biosynthesis
MSETDSDRASRAERGSGPPTKAEFTLPVSRHEREETPRLLGPESEVRPTLSVIMPTLNEEAGIATCIEKIKGAVWELGVSAEIIVSDSSTDRTPEIAAEMGATVVEPDQPGYGYAYKYAFRAARGEYIAIGDADCTYNFADIPRLLEPVVNGDADMAMGSRLEGEIKPGAMPKLHQYVGNPLLTRFLNVFYDAGVSDAHSGFRVITREALETLDLESDGMEFASEMIMDAAAKGLEIKEVPITYHEREGDATLESFQDGWRHVKFMLVNAPGYLFSIPGVILLLLGLLVMGVAYSDFSIGSVTLGSHSMVAGSLLTIIGFHIASLGVFARVTSDPIRRPTDRVTTWVVETMRLEYGATMGVGLFGIGAGYATYLVLRWIESGSANLPLFKEDVIAFTAIVLGVQIVFSSFFLSSVSEG